MAEIYNLVFGSYLRHDLHAGQQCTAEGRYLPRHRFGGYAGKQRAAAGANYLLRDFYLPRHGNAAGAGNAQLLYTKATTWLGFPAAGFSSMEYVPFLPNIFLFICGVYFFQFLTEHERGQQYLAKLR